MSNISRDSLTKAPVCSGEDAGDSPAPGANKIVWREGDKIYILDGNKIVNNIVDICCESQDWSWMPCGDEAVGESIAGSTGVSSSRSRVGNPTATDLSPNGNKSSEFANSEQNITERDSEISSNILMKKDTSISNKTVKVKESQGVDFFDWYDDPERSMGDDILPKEVVPNHGTQDCWERPNGGRGYVR